MAGEFRYDLIPRGSAVLCALSGGADSMYLLCRLLEGAEQGGYSVQAAHYNHRLRPTAQRDEDFVRDWCANHGVPLTVGTGDVAAHAAARGLGLEESGRELRYAFLQETAAQTGCTRIATGHHAGDNAETVLMNLIRGCGLNGLSGIPEQREGVIRPMLALTRAEIEAYLAAHAIPHVEDESNGDLSYTRNRIRHQLIPLLEELNPRAAAHITAAARRAGEDEAELHRQASALLEQREETDDGLSIPLPLLTDSPRPIALRVLKELVPLAQSVHLEQILALCHSEAPSAQLDIPGGCVRRVYDRLLVSAAPDPAPPAASLIEGPQRWGGWRITCTPAVCPGKAYVSPEEFYLKPGSYRIRSRREGDELKLGKRPQKTVKKLMIEARIPRHLRGHVPVLADPTDRPAAVGGLGPHWEALALPETSCIHITIKREIYHASGC